MVSLNQLVVPTGAKEVMAVNAEALKFYGGIFVLACWIIAFGSLFELTRSITKYLEPVCRLRGW